MSSPGSSNGDQEDSTVPDMVKEENKENDEKQSPKKEDKAKDERKSPVTNKSSIKDEKNTDESEESGDEEVGLLDRPVEVSGARERKKVQRLEISFNTPSKDKHEIPEGHGEKLGDCPRIEYQIQKNPVGELKILHKVLFSRFGSVNEIKRNIRRFRGFTFAKDSQEYEKKKASLEKHTLSALKHVCEVLDIERGGTKEDIVCRIMDFLLEPKASDKKVPKPRKKSSGKSVKRKSSEKKEKVTKNTADQRKKVYSSDDDAESSVDEDSDIKNDEDSDEPQKKKIKTSASKKKEQSKQKKNEKTKKTDNQKSASKAGKKRKAKSSSSEEEENDNSSSDDEPLVKMTKTPPTDDEIKLLVKKILQSADLQEITMKKVIKQVFDEFPEFDLSDRKDYIKATVKSVIS